MNVPLHERLSPVIVLLTGIGAALVLVQCAWITYGVFVRYVLRRPDGMVTEATALLLLPLAYAGLALALRENAFPKVSLLVDRLPRRARALVERLNLLLMVLVGALFALVAGVATWRSFQSGASSQVLEWPVYIFWAPVSIFIGVFALYGLLKLLHGSR